MWSWRPDCHLWDTCCCAHRLDCRSSGLGAGPRFPSRGALGLRETPLYVSGAGPLVYCLAVLPALKTWTFQRAEINVGCGTNPACPRFSLALGEGESCQQAVSCGKELGFTDIIETPLLGQVLGSVDRLFPSVTQRSHRHFFHGWRSPHQPWLPFFLWSQRHFSLAIFLTCLEPSLLSSAQEPGQHPMGSVTANLPRQAVFPHVPSHFIS